MVAILALVACSGDDDATTTTASPSEPPTDDSATDATTADTMLDETMTTTEGADGDTVAEAPEQRGRALWRGVLMLSTDSRTYVPYGVTETIADYDEATFSTTVETSEGVTSFVGSELSAFVGLANSTDWIEVDRTRATNQVPFVELTFEDGAVVDEFEASFEGEHYIVRRRISNRREGAVTVFVVIDEWYLNDELTRHMTSVSMHGDDDALLVTAEIAERTPAASLPSPYLPTAGVPIEAVANAISNSVATPSGFSTVPRQDDVAIASVPTSAPHEPDDAANRPFDALFGSVQANESRVRQGFGSPVAVGGRPEQAPNPGIGNCWKVDDVILCEEPGGGGVHPVGYPDREPPSCETDGDGNLNCWNNGDPPAFEEFGDDLIGLGADIDRFCARASGAINTVQLSLGLAGGVAALAGVTLPAWGLPVGLFLSLCSAWQWSAGIVHGDPHITTVDGVGYNFQSGGEFVYFRRPDFEVQSRFLGNPGVATSAEATAVRVGEHVIEVYYDDAGATNDAGVPVTIDGVTTRLSVEGQHFDDGSFVAQELGGRHATVIAVSPSGDAVRVENRWISQNVEILVRVDPGNPGSGLAGTANGDQNDDFLTRDGDVVGLSEINTIDGLYERFGESWRLEPEERLFNDVPAETFRTDEYLAVPDEYPSLARFAADERAVAEAECREAGIPDGAALEDCAYDLLANPAEDWAAQAVGSSATARRSDTNPRPSSSLSQTPIETEPDAPIVAAAFQCDLAAVEALIDEDSTIVNSRTSDDGWTPIMFAAQEGCPNVVTALVEAGASSDAAAEDGVYALYLAAQNGHVEIIQLLAESRSPVERSIEGGETPLLAAAFFGRAAAVAALLELGADPNVGRQSDGFTPLIAASQNAQVEIVRTLLASGALLELADNEGDTALMSAAANDAVDVVDILLDAGADVTSRSSTGSSVVQIATRRGNAELIDVLIEAGAPVNVADGQGFTPLIVAAQNGDIELVARLLAAGSDVAATTSEGVTALFGPAFNGATEIVASLLDSGAQASAARNDGITPLHLAAQESNDEVVELLLAAGADADAPDGDGATPLHYAASNALGSTVQLLVAAGADCTATDDRGLTPVDLASSDNQALLEAC